MAQATTRTRKKSTGVKKSATAKKAATKKKPAPKKKAPARAKTGAAPKPAAPGKTATSLGARDRKELARLVEDAIDRGADTAEEIHRSVLELPVSVLENLELKDAAADLRKLRDASIGSLYKLIHDVNHQVADLAVDLLEQRGKKRR